MACDCIQIIDAAFGASFNACLKTVSIHGPEVFTQELDLSAPGSCRVAITMEKARASEPYTDNEGKRAAKPWIPAKFCPFCGVLYVPEPDVLAAKEG